MSDRELLEMAAKSTGLHVISYSEGYGLGIEGNGVWWNPLDNDGDALRLLVSLNLCVDVGRRDIEAMWNDDSGEAYGLKEPGEKSAGDPFVNTRRAIVRAAAEIGRSMP